jgi:hypothetical protein
VFSNPTTPNLADYLTFLAGIGIPPIATPAVFPMVSGAATQGGDPASLTDFTQSWRTNQWAGSFLTDSTQGATTYLTSNTSVTVLFATPFANPVVAGDDYQIVPGIAPVSLSIALEIVNQTLAQVSPTIYTLAVYNLAADRLINYAPDVAGQTFFQDLRKKLRLSEISVGVPSQASTDGLATGILNPEQMKLFTLGDLQTLKTGPGRQYMSFAQMVGRTVYGLS